jgi:hypothetical protein
MIYELKFIINLEFLSVDSLKQNLSKICELWNDNYIQN